MDVGGFRVSDCKKYSLIKMPEIIRASDAQDFKSALEVAYEQGHNEIIIDCSDLRVFNATGIVYLLVYRNKLNERNGELKMVNIYDNDLAEKFKTIELGKVLSIE